LRAAPPNANCKVGSRHACGLTLQSRGRAPASRVTPLISNVRHRKNAGPSSYERSAHFESSAIKCMHLPGCEPEAWSSQFEEASGCVGAGCPSVGGQRTAAAVRYRFKCLRRACVEQRKESLFAEAQLAHRAEYLCGQGLALPSHSLLRGNTGSARERKAKRKRPCRHQLLRSTCRWRAFACKRRHPTHNAGRQ